MVRSRFSVVLVAFAFGLTLSNSAFGYLDGGTGSMMLQAAISGVLGALFLARSFFRDLPARFRKKPTIVTSEVEIEERKAA